MNELPWRCSSCGYENMVDFSNLQKRPIDKIISQNGFVCQQCGMWEAISYTNASLEEAVRKLSQYPPGHRKFQYLFAKALRRVESVQQRGETHGAFRFQDMASTR